MPDVEANGLRIEYDVVGAGDAPPILLIAGLGVQMIGWADSFRELLAAKGFRVIRFDNRDAGLSTHFSEAPVPALPEVAGALARGERPDTPYTLTDMADDAAGLLDALDIASAHVVGRSMGGMIGQIVASRRPDRVRSLTSIMSSSGNPALPPSTPEAMAVLTQRLPHPREDEQAYLDLSVRSARVLSSPGFPFDEAAQRAQILAAAKRAYNPAGFGRQLAALVADGDRRARLKSVTAPTLVLHGTADPLIPMAAGEDTAAHVSGARFEALEGMGHEIPPGLFETIAAAIAAHAKNADRSAA